MSVMSGPPAYGIYPTESPDHVCPSMRPFQGVIASAKNPLKVELALLFPFLTSGGKGKGIDLVVRVAPLL